MIKEILPEQKANLIAEYKKQHKLYQERQDLENKFKMFEVDVTLVGDFQDSSGHDIPGRFFQVHMLFPRVVASRERREAKLYGPEGLMQRFLPEAVKSSSEVRELARNLRKIRVYTARYAAANPDQAAAVSNTREGFQKVLTDIAAEKLRTAMNKWVFEQSPDELTPLPIQVKKPDEKVTTEQKLTLPIIKYDPRNNEAELLGVKYPLQGTIIGAVFQHLILHPGEIPSTDIYEVAIKAGSKAADPGSKTINNLKKLLDPERKNPGLITWTSINSRLGTYRLNADIEIIEDKKNSSASQVVEPTSSEDQTKTTPVTSVIKGITEEKKQKEVYSIGLVGGKIFKTTSIVLKLLSEGLSMGSENYPVMAEELAQVVFAKDLQDGLSLRMAKSKIQIRIRDIGSIYEKIGVQVGRRKITVTESGPHDSKEQPGLTEVMGYWLELIPEPKNQEAPVATSEVTAIGGNVSNVQATPSEVTVSSTELPVEDVPTIYYEPEPEEIRTNKEMSILSIITQMRTRHTRVWIQLINEQLGKRGVIKYSPEGSPIHFSGAELFSEFASAYNKMLAEVRLKAALKAKWTPDDFQAWENTQELKKKLGVTNDNKFLQAIHNDLVKSQTDFNETGV